MRRHALFCIIDEKNDRKKTVGNRRTDSASISSITTSNSPRSYLHNRIFSGWFGVPQKVHSKPDKLVRFFPSARANVVANEHVHMTRRVKFKTQHGAQGN